MRILALETSSDACSCALWLEGRCQVVHQEAPQRHAELLLEAVDQLLRDAAIDLRELDAIAFGRGPGSFTGLRIAAAAAQGLAVGAELPVLPVSSLLALARAAQRDHGCDRILAAVDARMGEVYWGGYAGQPLRPAEPEQVCAPRAVPIPPAGSWLGVGSGWERYPELGERLADRVFDLDGARHPCAAEVAALAAEMHSRGEQRPAEEAVPVYLRNRVTRRPGSTC